MLSAAAGRWIVTVTNTSDREISYDLNAFAAAKAGAPLTPGTAPRSISDEGLGARSGAGLSTSMPSATAAPENLLVAPFVAVDGFAVQRDDPRQGAAVRRCLLEYAAAPGRGSARLPPGPIDRATRTASGRVSKRSVGVG